MTLRRIARQRFHFRREIFVPLAAFVQLVRRRQVASGRTLVH